MGNVCERQRLAEDVSILYELALEIGQTLNVREACERFLHRLMFRKSQDLCVVWVDRGELEESRPRRVLEKLYVYPRNEVVTTLSRSSLLWGRVQSDRVFSVYGEDPLLCDVPGIDAKAGGVHSFIALSDFGCIYLHSRISMEPWSRVVCQQISCLADRFSVALRACFNHQVLVKEIQARRRAERELAYRAEHDVLTGLVNRAYAQEWLQREVDAASSSPFVIMYADLDNFKSVNDTRGHMAGDRVLKEVAIRIKNCVRQKDLVARLGGDEFLIVLPGVQDKAVAERVASKIIESCSSGIRVSGEEYFLGCSVGIAYFPKDSDNVEKLMSHADSALYDAKRSGRNCFRHYHDRLDKVLQRRLTIQAALRDALLKEEFELAYQPIVNLFSGEMVGVEALLRWHSTGLGRVSPDAFIPIAEDSGAIVEIGAWVLERAIRDLQQLQRKVGGNVFVSVNVSSVQLRAGGFDRMVGRLLEENGLHAEVLRLEITERVLLEEDQVTRDCIDKLHGMGVELSIDDFGTGYSALSYLSRIPQGSIKIDRSFVSAMESGGREASLVKAIIDMGHALGRSIVAEGIETEFQRKILEEFGCDMAQGYLYGRPMAMFELIDWVAESASWP